VSLYSKKEGGGVWHPLPLLPKLALSHAFPSSIQNDFGRKNEGFLSTDEEIFVVLNPFEMHRKTPGFIILSSFSHN